ncbi:MAG: GNAT family N-acetyltransferase [Pyrinomonadaceae bacterium]|nr:GNAT family N-acetyltransferase [Pyrinomonadaceae bacterium]
MTTRIRKAAPGDLPKIVEMELDGENSPFVNSDSLEKHTTWYEDDSFVHLAIDFSGKLTGYVLLVLDPDGKSVELRRIVVMLKGRGIGQDSLNLIDDYCRNKLARKSIWLDVLPTNHRAKHIYEKHGYEFIREGEHNGQPLHFYSKPI